MLSNLITNKVCVFGYESMIHGIRTYISSTDINIHIIKNAIRKLQQFNMHLILRSTVFYK